MNESLIRLLFLVHLASTLFMVGLIWFVQVVHYPLFSRVGTSEFPTYEQSHTSRTTWVVFPPMILELATAILLLRYRPTAVPLLPCLAGLALLLLIWLSTAFLQVPCHTALSVRYDPAVHRRLVATNTLRTLAWTLRGLLALAMTWPLLP